MFCGPSTTRLLKIGMSARSLQGHMSRLIRGKVLATKAHRVRTPCLPDGGKCLQVRPTRRHAARWPLKVSLATVWDPMARGLWSGTTELVEVARGILFGEQPMLIRQLFYRLVSVQALGNSMADYQRLIRLMTGARERDSNPACSLIRRNLLILHNGRNDRNG